MSHSLSVIALKDLSRRIPALLMRIWNHNVSVRTRPGLRKAHVDSSPLVERLGDDFAAVRAGVVVGDRSSALERVDARNGGVAGVLAEIVDENIRAPRGEEVGVGLAQPSRTSRDDDDLVREVQLLAHRVLRPFRRISFRSKWRNALRLTRKLATTRESVSVHSSVGDGTHLEAWESTKVRREFWAGPATRQLFIFFSFSYRSSREMQRSETSARLEEFGNNFDFLNMPFADTSFDALLRCSTRTSLSSRDSKIDEFPKSATKLYSIPQLPYPPSQNTGRIIRRRYTPCESYNTPLLPETNSIPKIPNTIPTHTPKLNDRSDIRALRSSDDVAGLAAPSPGRPSSETEFFSSRYWSRFGCFFAQLIRSILQVTQTKYNRVGGEGEEERNAPIRFVLVIGDSLPARCTDHVNIDPDNRSSM